MRLNLMPWRERRRAAAVRRFQASLLGSAVVALALVLVVDQLAQARLREQLSANLALRAQVEAAEQPLRQLDEVLEGRAQVERRQAALVRLRAGQQAVPNVLAALEQAAPVGVQVSGLRVQEGQLTLTGLAANAALVVWLVRDMQRLAMLRDVEVRHIRSSAEGNRFELVARLPLQGP
ncbi:PilN domain-containing protein [Pseudomonas sp.]|uniref:PilN domain-containing protein n=1 Tax=Pseudomonas sp. TaxID=306 RepID=UPI0028AC13EB|nr:PilN domain-containing protein [Pseudomonas sp.]